MGFVACVAQAVSLWGAAGDVTLNLKGAELTTLIETVSRATGKNFVLDPGIKGKVTVISADPISPSELYQMFLSILEVHGYIAVPVGNITKIVAADQLRFSGTDVGVRESNADEVVFKAFNLKYVDANRLIPVFRPMVSPKGHMAAHPDTNTLVVADYAASIARLERILARVDRPLTAEVEVIPLEHAMAVEIVRVVTSLEKEMVSGGKTLGDPVLIADERTNSVLLGGNRDSRLRLRAIITHLDTPVEASGNTRVVHLRFAKAKELVAVLANMGENFLKSAEKDKNKNTVVNVQAYDAANAVVITAPTPLLLAMQEVIRDLDVRRAQIQVEAIIAEITTDKVAELGVQWGALAQKDGQMGVVGGVNFPGANPGLIQLGASIAANNAGTGNSTDVLNVVNNVSGFILGGSDGKNIAALLRVLKNDAATNILSTPTVVTLDNEEAEIIVGNEVPFITSSTVNNVGNPFQTIKREKVGITLKVKPQINQGNAVRLDIEQGVSSLVPDAKGITLSDAVTRTRSIKTSVMVDNNEILVLGGLIQDDLKQTTSKVPFFGDLPLLGTLFRLESSNGVKTNLMVFLRPRILRNQEDGLLLTRGRYQYIREKQLAMPGVQGPVALEDPSPRLPKWESALRVERRLSHAAKDSAGEDEVSSPEKVTEGTDVESARQVLVKPRVAEGPAQKAVTIPERKMGDPLPGALGGKVEGRLGSMGGKPQSTFPPSTALLPSEGEAGDPFALAAAKLAQKAATKPEQTIDSSLPGAAVAKTRERLGPVGGHSLAISPSTKVPLPSEEDEGDVSSQVVVKSVQKAATTREQKKDIPLLGVSGGKGGGRSSSVGGHSPSVLPSKVDPLPVEKGTSEPIHETRETNRESTVPPPRQQGTDLRQNNPSADLSQRNSAGLIEPKSSSGLFVRPLSTGFVEDSDYGR